MRGTVQDPGRLPKRDVVLPTAEAAVVRYLPSVHGAAEANAVIAALLGITVEQLLTDPFAAAPGYRPTAAATLRTRAAQAGRAALGVTGDGADRARP